jgi:hypothetical protein
MGTNQTTNLADSSNMGPLSQVSGFTFVVNPSTAMIITGSPFLTNVSLVALQCSLSTKIFPPLASIGQNAFTVFPPSFLCRP